MKMTTWCYFSVIILVQFTTAQVKQYGAPNRLVGSANIARGLPNGLPISRNLAKRMPITEQLVKTMPTAVNNIANSNLVNAQNIANYKPYNMNRNFAFSNLANTNTANANFANYASASLANVNKVATKLPNNVVESNLVNPLMTKNDKATAVVNTNNVNANYMPNVGPPAILASNIVKPNTITGNRNIAYTSIANGVSPNMVTYNFGNKDIPISFTSGTPTNQPLGVQVLADKLEVAGTVSVSGRMPIYGTVTINGNVPTDGKASVNFGCGSPTV